jgi:SNF2 family DNA or RNA helicase
LASSGRLPSERRALWSVDEESLDRFVRALAQPPASPEWFGLRRSAEELALLPGFDTLIALDHNRVEELPHQIDVAMRVLRQMGGRAMLADEVGLGKTIEAGLILKELAVRGLARRILILTPAALVDQWSGELDSKFFEEFETPRDPDDWRRANRAIASYNLAVQKRQQDAILSEPWDLVILDEAHKIKNAQAATYKFISRIRRNYILLLTATPLQNELRELYNLITLLRPGQLGTWKEFSSKYLVRGDKRRVRNPGLLKDLTSQVMVRTRRSSVAQTLALPKRLPRHPPVRLTPDERALYDATVGLLRDLYARGFIQISRDEAVEDARRRGRRTGKGIMSLETIRLCQRLCSSSSALSESLCRLAEGELVSPRYRTKALELGASARDIREHGKIRALRRALEEHGDHVIVFSEHLPTLEIIREHVAQHGRRPIIYKGGLSRAERARQLKLFEESGNGVLVATRAGTEGLNLQFCNVLVNYELPWNPMVVEQRIGRIHRIGQKRDAHIISFAADDTIEAHVLELLDRKIKLFELVVGELDVILGEFGGKADGAETMEQRIAAELVKANSERELASAMETMGDEIARSRAAGLEQERLNSEVSGDDNAMRLEREFAHLSIPARIRLGFGTKHLNLVEGIRARQEHLLITVPEILEALEGAAVRTSRQSPSYGALVWLHGVTRRGRGIDFEAQADRLPMLLVTLNADPAT